MENKRIAVFGATGKIGSELINRLSQEKVETIAVTRNLNKATPHRFIKWVQADISDIQSLNTVMENSKAVFLLSSPGPDFVEGQKNVIKAAKQSGIKHLVKLSSGAADQNSAFYIPRIHGVVEDFLIKQGIPYTLLRPMGIMQNWLGEIAENVKKEQKFYEATGAGKRAHVDLRDIAEVAFKCLTEPEKHHNQVYSLSSDVAVNYYDVAEAISKAIHKKVTYIPISLDEARQEMKRNGMPSALIETFISYDAAQRNGETEMVTDCVRTILGKPARTIENFAKDYADQFRSLA
ncbi:SDR family oxidoreductase [Pedobacter zeae]|uniref:NAD(P)-dependent oxidoreductase n=1 Tax=Pedobacter zeae TaxID=1737356 RepID=A0A7W6K7Q9_9SPHI|nr:SDR family oxidoreductase [Pedobacter zeae]MBB4106736.1 uncharacterized protein YbjT (DUF2867 family) [Pedobacter zeae]GGH03455.1 NAD(P)-dependent oxidoreductase [Pedobacter zeae]